jgi:hypothetical protein
MDAAQALIAVTAVYSVGIGIVIGAVVVFFRHHAADHFRHREADLSFQSGMPTVPAQEIDATALHSPQSPVPRANNLWLLRPLRPLIALLVIIILIAITEGFFFVLHNKALRFRGNPK